MHCLQIGIGDYDPPPGVGNDMRWSTKEILPTICHQDHSIAKDSEERVALRGRHRTIGRLEICYNTLLRIEIDKRGNLSKPLGALESYRAAVRVEKPGRRASVRG
jgi:hypothetical protein